MPTFNNLVAVFYSVLHQLFARSFGDFVIKSREKRNLVNKMQLRFLTFECE